MSFEVSYTLRTLGNPPSPFMIREALWWGEWEPIAKPLRTALRQIDRKTATKALLAAIRDHRAGGHHKSPEGSPPRSSD